MEIVIPTIRNVDFLEKWRQFFSKHHIIVIQDGPATERLKIPKGFDVTVYTRKDIEKDLGDDVWIIPYQDGGCRVYGFLKAREKYVLSLDDDCFPARNPNNVLVDILKEHERNLSSPSHPNFFNTMYDQEFVRGFPHERRGGVPTVISHGLWLNVPDLDAPTQRDNPDWRNKKIIDAVITIPQGVMYPLCFMNCAFSRDHIGLAMYSGLTGKDWSWSRYDDMWAGWCSKVICDHLGLGVKSGKPYIWHEKASRWEDNMKKEAFGLKHQEKIIQFFESVQLTQLSVSSCYVELADFVQRDLQNIDPFFIKQAQAMRVWAKLWQVRN